MKKGYSLVEVLVALVIFSFMALALSGVFATANRFFSHQYREDVLKTRFIVAMKYIQNRMMTANEILSPPPGGVSNYYITFLTNVSLNPANSNQICRPVSTLPSMWHYICLNGNTLFYHSGNFTINDCPNYSFIPVSAQPTTCGPGGINAVFLSDNINSVVFSRQNLPSNIVRVNMTLFSKAKGDESSYAGIVGRDISHTFETYIAVNRVTQF